MNTRHFCGNCRFFFIIIVWAAILSSLADYSLSFTTNGTGKVFDFAITSASSGLVSSSNFKTYSEIGGVASTLNSSDFKTDIGFIRTAYYLNGESCSVNLECASGFCCSNLCQSGACPAPASSSSSSSSSSGGGGGGGGGSLIVEKTYGFEFEQEFIKALIKQGGIYKTRFSLINTGTEDLDIELDYSSVKGFVLLSDNKLRLKANSKRSIDATIFAPEDTMPEVYTGNILAIAGDIKKSLPVIIEVQAKKALFDIKVEVLSEYKYILTNESAAANITLVNVGDLQPVDVNLYYAIRDLEGNEVLFGHETLAVYNRISTIKYLDLPRNISIGTYVFFAKVAYGTEAANAGDLFYIVNEKPELCKDRIKNQNEIGIDCGGPCGPCADKSGFFQKKWIIWLMIALAVIALIFAFMLSRSRQEEEAEKAAEAKKKVIAFIDLAYIRGYTAEQIRSLLISKGVGPETVDKELSKVAENDRKVIEYVDRALMAGHHPKNIHKTLADAGWPQARIHRHITERLKRKYSSQR